MKSVRSKARPTLAGSHGTFFCAVGSFWVRSLSNDRPPAHDHYTNVTGISVAQCSAPSLNRSINANSNQVTNTGYAYDSAGNVTNDGTYSHTWNAEGRMATAAGYTYSYDGDGKRVEKTDGTHTKLYGYGPNGEVLAETDLSGNVLTEYIYFGGQRIALSGNHDQVNVVGHEAVAQDRELMQAGIMLEQVQIHAALGIGSQNELTRISPLRNMVRGVEAYHACETSHGRQNTTTAIRIQENVPSVPGFAEEYGFVFTT